MTADYCRERKAFGHSILDNQVVHYTLAELATEVESLRSMLYRAVGNVYCKNTLLNCFYIFAIFMQLPKIILK